MAIIIGIGMMLVFLAGALDVMVAISDYATNHLQDQEPKE